VSAVRLEPYPGERPGSRADHIRAQWHDGRLLIGLGVFGLGVALPEAIRWVAGADGRIIIFPALAVVGAGAVLWGLGKRRAVGRRVRAAITVATLDPAGPLGGEEQSERAVAYGRRHHELTFAVSASLTGSAADVPVVEQLARCARRAIGLADRFRPGSPQLNLIPMMRLHVAFWFGAHLRRSHTTPIALWQTASNGDGYYLAATLSLPGPPPEAARQVEPPLVPSVETFTSRLPTRVALAVSVRRRDAASEQRIRARCRAIGVDQLLWLRGKSEVGLSPDTGTITAALDQVEREWVDRMPAAATTYVAFLDTTVTLAVGIGARLADTGPSSWVAYTKDQARAELVRFPPEGADGL
jgi:hypothetical protein